MYVCYSDPVKVLQGLFLLLFTPVLSVVAFLTASAFRWADELPPVSEIEKLEYTATSQIFDVNGQLLDEILPVTEEGGAPTNRTVVTLDEVSPAVIAALVASEDDAFFRHYGFDTLALLRATYEEFLGGQGRGGSTLTTQVAKNTLLADLANDRSLERKVKELMLAIEIERRLTKEEILQQYLNVVYWGKNFYGIHAASRAYFDKDPLELNLAEALYLVRLLPAPETNYEDFASTRRAMRVVLNNMVEQGVVSREMAERAWRYPLEPIGWRVQYDEAGEIIGEPERLDVQPRVARTVGSSLNPHVVFAVRNEMNRLFPNLLFRAGGFRIYTTIDARQQEAANRAAQDPEGILPEGAQLALVSIDPHTGGIRAMAGGRLGDDAKTGDTFNRATSARRQPGSSFKPIIVATALEQGGFTQASLIADDETAFEQPGRSEPWTPRNHDGGFDGLRTLRSHLDRSRNIPMVKLVEALTPQAVVTRASQLGYDNLLPVPSIALGAFEVTPLVHASAMGAFASGGVHVQPHLIERVTDAEGNVLYEAQPRRTQVWSETTAFLMLDMLRGNVIDREPFGLSNRAAIEGRWVGGKTGTTNDERDIWFVGLTPELVAAVWIGYDDNRSLPKTMPNGELVNSSRQPVWVWRNFAEEALAGVPAREVTAPEGIVFREIDLQTGMPAPSPEEGTRVAFASGTEPGARAQPLSYLTITVPIDTRTNARATAETPLEALEWREISPSEVQASALPPPAATLVALGPAREGAGGLLGPTQGEPPGEQNGFTLEGVPDDDEVGGTVVPGAVGEAAVEASDGESGSAGEGAGNGAAVGTDADDEGDGGGVGWLEWGN
jgi:penicillin-binding protein 1A